MNCVTNDIKDKLNPSDEMIWNNQYIRSSGNVLYFTNWIKSGIIKCNDLFQDDNMFLSMAELSKKVKKTSQFWIEYCAVKTALLRNWQKRIMEGTCVISDDHGLNLVYFIN